MLIQCCISWNYQFISLSGARKEQLDAAVLMRGWCSFPSQQPQFVRPSAQKVLFFWSSSSNFAPINLRSWFPFWNFENLIWRLLLLSHTWLKSKDLLQNKVFYLLNRSAGRKSFGGNVFYSAFKARHHNCGHSRLSKQKAASSDVKSSKRGNTSQSRAGQEMTAAWLPVSWKLHAAARSLASRQDTRNKLNVWEAGHLLVHHRY